eukprot:scaffold764_cov248-Pinguiococcus_pyrenoidosus.AAC.35
MDRRKTSTTWKNRDQPNSSVTPVLVTSASTAPSLGAGSSVGRDQHHNPGESGHQVQDRRQHVDKGGEETSHLPAVLRLDQLPRSSNGAEEPPIHHQIPKEGVAAIHRARQEKQVGKTEDLVLPAVLLHDGRRHSHGEDRDCRGILEEVQELRAPMRDRRREPAGQVALLHPEDVRRAGHELHEGDAHYGLVKRSCKDGLLHGLLGAVLGAEVIVSGDLPIHGPQKVRVQVQIKQQETGAGQVPQRGRQGRQSVCDEDVAELHGLYG